jgi:hypothetical protein
MKKSGINTFYILLLLIILMSADPISINPEQKDVKLAGNAIFPAKEHNDWLKFQQDRSFGSEEKIKSTIETYFMLQYESWFRDELLDFGFLFEQDNSETYECYAHERGLLYLSLARWRYYNIQLKHYESTPDYMEFSLDSDGAKVKVWPSARIIHKDVPDIVTESPLDTQTITLVLRDNLWLIQNITSDDPERITYPRGTDFNELVDTYEERQRSAMAEADALVSKFKDDPRVKMREKQSQKYKQEYLEEQRRKNEQKLEIYHSIAGTYFFEGLGNISFYVQNSYLLAMRDEDSVGVILQRVEEKPFEFEYRPDRISVYHLKFSNVKEDQAMNCLISGMGIEIVGKRIKNR